MGICHDDRYDSATPEVGNSIEPWLEASALVLLSVLPLMLTPLANFFFEGTKSFLFHSFGLIGAVLLAAWAVLTIMGRRAGAAARPRERHPPWRGFGLPLLAALLCIGAQGAATFFALQRDYALHGAPGRGGGWLTLFSACILLVIALVVARRPTGMRRLLEALALGTLAPAAIGLLQRFGLDPLGAGGEPAERVSGTFGNPMFLGSYLALVSPLTIWLAWIHARLAARRQAVLYGLLALLQLAALWFTGSRGPLGAWAGAAAMALPLALLAAGQRRLARRLAALILLGLCAALLLFHILFVQSFNASGPPTAKERAMRVRSVLVRFHIYRTVAVTMTDRVPLARADRPDLTDRHVRLRPWIGFGPQNLALITGRHFPPDLERLERGNRIIDAAHNQLLETWADAGLAGIGSLLLLLLATLALLLRPLGLCATPAQTRRAMCLVLGTTAILFVALVCGWGLWAWPLGFTAGIFAGLLVAVIASPAGAAPQAAVGRPPAAAMPLQGLPIALTAAFLAQLLDSQSNVVTVATTMGFWLVLGLIMRLESARAACARQQPDDAPPSAGERGVFLLLALVTAITLHASLALNDSLSLSLGRVLADAWRAGAIPLGAAVCLAGMARAGWTARGWALLGGGWMAGAILWSFWLARLFGPKLKTATEVLAFGDSLAVMSGARFLWVACGMLAAGCLLATARPRRGVRLCAALIVLGGMSAMLAWQRSGQRAAALDATARFLENAKRDDLSAACLERALGRSPWDERFHLRRYAIFGRMAKQASNISSRDATMIQALTSLQGALRASPYDTGHPERLGMLYYNWAVQSPADGSRQLLGKEAVTWMTRAANLTPGRSSVALKAMDAAMVLADDTPHAEKLLRAILVRDPANARAAELLAHLSWHLSRLTSTPPAQRVDRRQEAILLARRALDSPWRAYYKKMDIQRLRKIAAAESVRPPSSVQPPPGRRADRE